MRATAHCRRAPAGARSGSVAGGEELGDAFTAGLAGGLITYGSTFTEEFRVAAQRFGAMRGDPDYNPRYDLNADGFIDITDMSTVQSRFGQTCR